MYFGRLSLFASAFPRGQRRSALLFLLLFSTGSQGTFGTEAPLFPRPESLQPAIAFWTRVYTEVDSHSGYLHDNRQLNVIYEVVRFKPGMSRRAKQRQVDRLKSRYRGILRTLSQGKRNNLTAEQTRVLSLWPEDVSSSTLRTAAKRLRFQLGQADKFRAGIVRSGAWHAHIRATLRRMGLPEELTALPHVESSYNPEAYSHRGAAGIWQFTRSTGRRYLRVDHVVDERMDPFAATVAAARLLKHNYAVTGTWPLAITSYNHGAAGMRRAVRQLGTRDIGIIVERYRSRRFGFASRNFYAAFLAAVDVENSAEEYFGPLKRSTPPDLETVKLKHYVKIDTVERALGVSRPELKRHNRALRSTVWNGTKYVPRNYELRVPKAREQESLGSRLAGIAPAERFTSQRPDVIHKVRRGDTLSHIADRYGVSAGELVALNGLRSRHRIRAGQVLRLPVKEGHTSGLLTVTEASVATPPEDGSYTVRRGDTLSRIARRFGISEHDIIRVNGLKNRNRIYVGQSLKVASSKLEPGRINGHQPIPTKKISVEGEKLALVAPETDDQQPSSTPSPSEESAPEAVDGLATPAPSPPTLSADPSDYTVSQDRTIEVQAAETLGHYADWLDLRASQLRRLNGMRYGTPVVVGHRLRLDFSRISPESFEARRMAYHRDLQEGFFDTYQIVGACQHVIQRGESVWLLAQHNYQVPIWLLRQYNPDLDLNAVIPGTSLQIPIVEIREQNLPSVQAQSVGVGKVC